MPECRRFAGWPAALGALLAASTLALPACAQTPGAASAAAACANAYGLALSALRAGRGEELANAVALLRAPDPKLPGRWIYSADLFGKTFRESHPLELQRPCAEKVKIAGRIRCARYADADPQVPPDLPAELDIPTPPNKEEMRFMKAVQDLVVGRGAIPDVGPNGRQTWLATRAASDLNLYVTQQPHHGLCSGAKEVAEFYAMSLKPLEKRVVDVGEMVTKVRALAAARVVEVLALAQSPAITFVPAVNPASSATDKAADPALAERAAKPPLPSLAEIAKHSLPAMTADAVRTIVSAAETEAVAAEASPIVALERAKPALIRAQVDAQKGDDQSRRDRILAAGRAVRMIETAAYAELYDARYQRFSASVLTLPREIEAARERACTCGF